MRNNKVLSHVANELDVKLDFKVERAYEICKDCGFFGHGGGTCDKGLICGLSLIDVVSIVYGEPKLLASQPMEVVGLVKEPVLQVEEAVSTGLEDGLSYSEEAIALVVTPPTFSAGNPSFKLGLTEQGRLTESDGPRRFRGPPRVGPSNSRLKRKFCFGTEFDRFRPFGYGFRPFGDGSAGTDLVLKKPKSAITLMSSYRFQCGLVGFLEKILSRRVVALVAIVTRRGQRMEIWSYRILWLLVRRVPMQKQASSSRLRRSKF
ncbi:hypothetical protein ACLB2K_052213 [Fragaria x ananassa]